MRRIALLVIGLFWAASLFATAGDLDCLFGTGGISKTDLGGDNFVYDVFVRSDGKIVALGGGVLARFDSAGALDPTFGSGGTSTLPFTAYRMAIDSTGRILVAGVSGSQVGVARFTPEGDLDTSFGSGTGSVAFDFGAANTLNYVAGVGIDSSDRVIVGGSSDIDSSYGNRVFAFARLTPSGDLDTSFNHTGKWLSPASSSQDDWMYAMTVQADGKPVGAGNRGFATNPRHHLVMRLNTDGTPDTTFGTNGQFLWYASGSASGDDYAYDVKVDNAGRIVVGGGANGDDSVSRLTSGGALDTSFNGSGVYLLTFGGQIGGAPRLAIQSDNKILVTDLTISGNFVTGLARLTTSGALDTTFSGDGKLTTQATFKNYANAVVLQPDAKIIVGGGGTNGGPAGYDFLLQRYLNDNNASPATTTTITSDTPDPSNQGQSVTVNFTVTSAAGTPTGTVTVSDGFSSCSASVATGNCSLVLNIAGTRTLTATYGGSPSFCTSSGTASHVVNSTATTTTINSANPNPSVIFTPVTVSVTVAANAGGTPTGSVNVSDSGNLVCTATLSNGNGSCTFTPTLAGTRTLSALYLGDSTFTGSQGVISHTFSRAASTLAITSDSANPSSVGQAVSFGVSLLGNAGAGLNGIVTISDAATTASCNATVINGSGNCSLTFTTPGTRTVNANFAGNANYLSTAATASHTVNMMDTAVAISAPNPSNVGADLNVSVAVSAASGTPTGLVAVSDGQGATCTATLANGAGTCDLIALVAGSRNIVATYSGDASYNSSSTSAVHQFNKAPTTTAIAGAAPASSQIASPLQVAVTVAGAGAPISGTVVVSDGLGATCSSPVVNGSASCTLVAMIAGTRDITASYSGDANHLSSSAAVAHEFDKVGSITHITSASPDPSVIGASVTVSVALSGPAAPPTGNVQVSDGQGATCTATIVNGTASCGLTAVVAGARNITASYSGDASYLASSNSIAHTFQQAPTTTTIVSHDPNPSPAGSAVTVNVSVASAVQIPTGTVTVSDGTDSCTATLDNDGNGSCAVTLLLPGAHTLTATYSGDANYLTSSATAQHQVGDVTPPTFNSVKPSLTVLWPPNHSLVPVTIAVNVTDDFDPSPAVQIIGVTSNQPSNGTGDGNTSSDWKITGPLSVSLRSERAGNGGDRIYTITLEARDASGNASQSNVQIHAPQHK